MREGVAEEAGDAADDVDARPAQLVQRDDLDARQPPALACQTGRTPSSANTWAMSSPWVRIALVPQTLRPTLRVPARLPTVALDQLARQLLADAPGGGWAGRADRPRRSCGRSAARGPCRASARRSGRPARTGRRARAECSRSQRAPMRRDLAASRGKRTRACATTVSGTVSATSGCVRRRSISRAHAASIASSASLAVTTSSCAR